MQNTQSLKPYRTIQKASETEQLIQKSRFIGRCFPVSSADAAAAVLEQIRKQHWDASHNCYAFRVGTDFSGARSSDDGEPSGTAGAPILNVLNRLELVDVLCVVTRYFGGVLLGTGGLTRAYSNAASAAAEAAGIVHMVPASEYTAVFTYSQWAAVQSAIQAGANVTDVAYTDVVCAVFWLQDALAEPVLLRIRDLTDGKVAPNRTARAMRPDCR